MSGFEAEGERLRREVEDAVRRVLELVREHSSKLSEIERKVGLEKATPGLWELLKEVKGLRFEAREAFLKARGELFRVLRDFRDRVREAALAEPRRRDELREVFDDLKDFFEDQFDGAEDSLEEFLERAEDVEDEIRERIRELKREVKKEVYAVGFGGPEAARIAVAKLPDIGKLVEESLSKAFSGASMIVSSVRLPRVDLDLIDALVEAGIFKSRNEGIAFFAHKGIEASKDWLLKAREKIEEIKRLQEETKKELERMLGEDETGPGRRRISLFP
ncbi:MAG: hypothetical protein N3F08_01525 [Crenarchaeota archaeon]|nr:hypothetical protein [Thermoproteota archaeon]